MTSRTRLAILLALALASAAPAARGGITTVNFNDLTYAQGYDPGSQYPAGPAPGTGSYDNGWDLKGGFTSGGVAFGNSYDTTYHSWSGWAYSNVNDPTKTGPSPNSDDYKHQFAAVAGPAPTSTGNYAIFNDPNLDGSAGGFINLAAGTSASSITVTNSTYTYLSMLGGDGFAKKFGQGDSLVLKIFGYAGLNGTGGPPSEVDFTLGTGTATVPNLVSTWTTVDLAKLAGARSIGFGFASTDNGSFGINTPLYFAMDNLTLVTPSVDPSAVPEPSSAALALAGLAIAGLAARRRARPVAAG